MNWKKKFLSVSPRITSKIVSAVLAVFVALAVIKIISLITSPKTPTAEPPSTETNGDSITDENISDEVEIQKDIINIDNVLSITYGVSAESGLLYNIDKNEIVCEKNMKYQIGVGDLSDFAAAIVISEKIESGDIKLSDTVVCPAMAAKRPNYLLSSSVYAVGERLDIETLLKCLIYQRGSSFLYALAVHISGSEENFVSEMNQLVSELGASSTKFTNVCGQDDGTSKTTAYDTAIILKKFFETEIICEIFTSNDPVIIRKNGIQSSVYLTVTNDFFELNCTENQAREDGIIGGKSGSSGYLGWCAVMFYDGNCRYISLSLSSSSAFADSMFIYARRDGGSS